VNLFLFHELKEPGAKNQTYKVSDVRASPGISTGFAINRGLISVLDIPANPLRSREIHIRERISEVMTSFADSVADCGQSTPKAL
jgi:hypothetical protein